MQKYMRICPICEKENDRSIFKSNLYVPGWFDFWDNEPADGTTCDFHNEQSLLKSNITCEEFQILRQVSNDTSFMRAMDDLKEKDSIEYQLKLSQFKAVQAQQSREKEKSEPHCPHCKSTNISKIGTGERIGSIAMLGIFSKKINKSFKCKNCGYTW